MNESQDYEDTNSKRILELIELIKQHNRLYYEMDAPTISDFEYDELFRELKQLRAKHSELYKKLVNKNDDPLAKVGGEKPSEGFESFTHPSAMMSLNNVMNEAEFLDYAEKTLGYLNLKEDPLVSPPYVVSHKFDGLALELIYEEGFLKIAATRGNGFVGEKVNHSVHLIKNLITKLKNPPPRLVVRGEAVMMRLDFEKLNARQEKMGLPLFSNPRNVAAGSLRQLDKIDEERKLHFFAYQIENVDELEKDLNIDLDTYLKQIDFLKQFGFDTNEATRGVTSLKEAKDYYEHCLNSRANLPYEIDGVVFRFNEVRLQNLLGAIDRRPRHAIAWKFPPELATTQILEVHFQIGRTGVLTPVGILKPVSVGGAIVKRVTLHNADEITRKDIKIGDTVEIIRSGDVIPKITRVIKEKRTREVKDIIFPKTCPSCAHPIITTKESENTFYYCPNFLCPDQIHQRLLHFCSKEAMDIEGFDEKLCREILDKKLISSPSGLYLLKDEDFMKLERMGEKRKSNLKNAIEKSKTTTLSRFIFALGIQGLGQKMSSMLAKEFKGIEKVLEAKKEDFLNITGVGDISAQAIEQFFHDESNLLLIKELLDRGVRPTHSEALGEGPLKGEKILFTGSLSIPRNIAKSHAERLGAEVMTSISARTTLLIVGNEAGSKLKKAEELGIKIMNEKDFLDLL